MVKTQKKDKCLIYLADLAHNYAANGPFTFPINIGYIASYASKVYGDKIEISLFKFPKDLIDAIKETPPDLVGFGNYTWNLDINVKICSWVKNSFTKEIVTVIGGPDYPIDEKNELRYLKERPDVDFFVLNQGEIGFTKILERYFQSNSIERMKDSALENCSFYDKVNECIVHPPAYNYIEELNDIPSPYLSGLMDKFFDYGLIPMIETNRGCPYKCTFCVWGNAALNKLLQFSTERIFQEIEYIAIKSKKTDLFKIADANFGILKRDIEITKFLVKNNKKYNYPRYVSSAWAKNAPDRIIEMAEILGSMVSISASMQSMDMDVLESVKRGNIKNEHFSKIQSYFKSKGISSFSEMILGLPLETKESHLSGLKKLFDINASGIVSYNLRMLSGSEMDTYENRDKYGLNAKYRLVDGGFGKYDDIISIEHEEMVVQTKTMSEEDILYFRPIHFLIQFLWNYKYYESLINFLHKEGINPIDFITKLMDEKDKAPSSIKKMLDKFTNDACEELFDTKEDFFSHYSTLRNFNKISNGEFGKLNFQYTFKILLECKDDFDTYLFSMAKNMFKKNSKKESIINQQLNDLLIFSRGSFFDFKKGFNNPELNKTFVFNYDILKWKKEGFAKPLSFYKAENTKLNFVLPTEQVNALKKLYKQFEGKNINQTLRKMVESMNKNDLFYKIDYLNQNSNDDINLEYPIRGPELDFYGPSPEQISQSTQ